MNQQRELIYSRRRNIITEESSKEEIFSILESIISEWLINFEDTEEFAEEFCKKLMLRFLINLDKEELLKFNKDEITEKIIDIAKLNYSKKEKYLGEEKTKNIEKMVMLGVIDSNWKDYLFSMDQLREGIMWRSYGQKDPLVEYQHEAFAMFKDLIMTVDEAIVERIFKTFAIEERFREGVFRQDNERLIHEDYSALNRGSINQPGKQKGLESLIPGTMPDTRPHAQESYKRETPKVGRNEPCPCGSGLKYKKCCGK